MPQPTIMRIGRTFLWSVLIGFLVIRGAQWQGPILPTEGLPYVRWPDADKVVGTVAVVSGKIVRIGRSGRIHFLNFDRNRRDVFKVVVFEEHLNRFPKPLAELYDQQKVMVHGPVTLYRDVPQIQVTSPDQITVIDTLPPDRFVKVRPRTVGKRIRIGTFNIRNLFDDVDDPYHMDETTNAKPRSELIRLAATIRAIDLDGLALQEVENRGYLQRFVDVFLRDMGYEVIHFSGNDRRGSGLALLTRLNVGSVTSHRHRRFPKSDGTLTRFSRDLLCVQLLPRNKAPFEIWSTHLKSKRGGAEGTEPQRLAEAAEIRRLVDLRLNSDPTARLIVVGDFNDTINSRPLRQLIVADERADSRLTGYWQSLPEGSISYNQAPHQEMIDFIFCSPAAAAAYVAQSYRIQHDTLEHSGSDHNPVIAEFEF